MGLCEKDSSLDALENKVSEVEKSGTQEEVYQNLEGMSANVEHLEANCDDLKRKLVTTEKVNEDLKANIEELSKERDENKVLKARLESLQKENEVLVKKALDEQNLMEESFERMHSASNVTIRPKTPVQVEPFEEGSNEVFELEEMGESSPDFHGFSDAVSNQDGISKTEQLSHKIEEMEVSSNDSASSNNSDEVPPLPKRKERPDDGFSPNNSKIKKSEKHPDVGSNIVVETIKGKGAYFVESKKNKRSDDYSYVLVNADQKSTSFDMKDIKWVYMDEVDPLKSPQKESETPSQE